MANSETAATESLRRPNPWGWVVLVTAVLVVGIGAAYWGYGYGQQARLDVTAPITVDIARNLDSTEKASGFLNETQVLAKVAQSEITLRSGGLLPAGMPAVEGTDAVADLEKSDIFTEPEVVAAADAGYTTQKVESGSVQLQVVGVQRVEPYLVIDINLSNQGSQDRRFLYGDAFNLLVISDERGKRLSTLTNGLPGSLPAGGGVYSGSIEIPLDELGEARYLRLNLQAFPTGDVNLVVSSLKVPG